MEAISEDTFLIRAAGANVTFEQDDSGEVAAMKEKNSLPPLPAVLVENLKIDLRRNGLGQATTSTCSMARRRLDAEV